MVYWMVQRVLHMSMIKDFFSKFVVVVVVMVCVVLVEVVVCVHVY